MKTWKPKNLKTWKPGNLKIWQFENLKTLRVSDQFQRIFSEECPSHHTRWVCTSCLGSSVQLWGQLSTGKWRYNTRDFSTLFCVRELCSWWLRLFSGEAESDYARLWILQISGITLSSHCPREDLKTVSIPNRQQFTKIRWCSGRQQRRECTACALDTWTVEGMMRSFRQWDCVQLQIYFHRSIDMMNKWKCVNFSVSRWHWDETRTPTVSWRCIFMSVFGRKFCNKNSRKFKQASSYQLVKISSMFSQVLSGLEPPLDLSTTIFGHKVVLKINYPNLNKIGF